MTLRHFLNTQDWSRTDLDALLAQAAAFKRSKLGDQLKGRSIALVLKSSTKSWVYDAPPFPPPPYTWLITNPAKLPRPTFKKHCPHSQSEPERDRLQLKQ